MVKPAKMVKITFNGQNQLKWSKLAQMVKSKLKISRKVDISRNGKAQPKEPESAEMFKIGGGGGG